MHYVAIVLIIICFDVLTGIVKALSTKSLCSAKMRAGLYRKSGEILSVFAGVLFDYGNEVFALGFNVSILYGICTYISIMELLSIIENLCEINPLLSNIFSPYLDKLKGDNNVKRD